jgi:hypothetical protein
VTNILENQPKVCLQTMTILKSHLQHHQTSGPGSLHTMATFKEKMAELRAQPHRREWDRMTTMFLRQLKTPKWGFAIYRTVYTPESDELFPKALAKLDAYVYINIMSELYLDSLKEHSSTKPPFDPKPNQQIAEKYENVILKDKAKYEGASMDQIREYFKQWVKDQGGHIGQTPKFHICLVIDEVAMHALVDTPEPTEAGDNPDVLVRVVDGKFVPGESTDEDYQGWIKTSVSILKYLYQCVDQSELLHLVYILEGRDDESYLFTG